MREFLEKLGINYPGTLSPNGNFVIELDDNTWGKVYSILDKSELVDEDEDISNLALDSGTLQYYSDDYSIALIADFDTPKYQLVCKEI